MTLLCAAALVAAPSAAAVSSVPDKPGYDVNGNVFAIARLGDTIYIGGSFTTVNGLPRTNLAAISAVDGSVTSWAPTTNGTVRAIVASGSTIYVGGLFASVGDSAGAHARSALAAFDTTGNALAWDPNASAGGSVYALALNGSRIYVGGQFTSLGPVGGTITESNLGVVDAAGAGLPLGWATNPPDPNTTVNALDVSPDGSILYVGGNFGQIGNPAPQLNRLGVAAVRTSDGVVDPNWDPADPAGGGFVDDVAVGPSGTLYLVGDFFPNIPGQNSMGFAPRYYAAEVEPAGNGATGAATAFAPDADSEPFAIALGVDGMYIGGTFSNLNANGTRPPQQRPGAGSVDYGTGDAQAWNPAPNNDVNVLFAASDGSVYMGGGFTALGTGAGSGFASFSPPPTSTSAPTIEGIPQPGHLLTCTQGTWAGALPQTYSTQGLYDGTPVGPVDSGYVVQPGDVGHTLGCSVTAHNRTADVTAVATPVTVTAAPVAPAVTPPRGLAAPVYRQTANAYPQSGTVLVKLPGTKSFVPLSAPEQIPFGSIIDATRGKVRICTADARGKVECSDFYGGVFKLTQLRGSPAITVLTLVGGNFKKCARPRAGRSTAEAATKPKSIRHLWGSGSGHFRTVGRFASATIRGTTWLTDDRCDGTLIRVKAGAVTVRDRVKNKSFALRAPRKYLAKAGKRRA